MLQQAYGEDCVSRTQCHEWYQRFKSGRTPIEDDPKCGRPSTSMDDDHDEKVLAVIRENHHLIVREVAEEVGICKCPCHLILTDKLKMHRVAAKFVPHLLTDALLIHEFLMKHETTVVPQQPCSPDLAPAESILFPKLKSSLKGRQFQTVQEREQIRYGTFTPSSKTRSRTCSRIGKNIGSGILRVEGSTLKETSLINL